MSVRSDNFPASFWLGRGSDPTPDGAQDDYRDWSAQISLDCFSLKWAKAFNRPSRTLGRGAKICRSRRCHNVKLTLVHQMVLGKTREIDTGECYTSRGESVFRGLCRSNNRTGGHRGRCHVTKTKRPEGTIVPQSRSSRDDLKNGHEKGCV